MQEKKLNNNCAAHSTKKFQILVSICMTAGDCSSQCTVLYVSQNAEDVAATWLAHTERQEHIELLPPLLHYTLAGIIKATFGTYFDAGDRMEDMQNQINRVGI